MASEIQLKAPFLRSGTKACYRKSRLFSKTAWPAVPNRTDFSVKIIFPSKSGFLAKGANFSLKKGGTMCKNFKGINFGSNIFGQQLLELVRELSDVDYINFVD